MDYYISDFKNIPSIDKNYYEITSGFHKDDLGSIIDVHVTKTGEDEYFLPEGWNGALAAGRACYATDNSVLDYMVSKVRQFNIPKISTKALTSLLWNTFNIARHKEKTDYQFIREMWRTIDEVVSRHEFEIFQFNSIAARHLLTQKEIENFVIDYTETTIKTLEGLFSEYEEEFITLVISYTEELEKKRAAKTATAASYIVWTQFRNGYLDRDYKPRSVKSLDEIKWYEVSKAPLRTFDEDYTTILDNLGIPHDYNEDENVGYSYNFYVPVIKVQKLDNEGQKLGTADSYVWSSKENRWFPMSDLKKLFKFSIRQNVYCL